MDECPPAAAFWQAVIGRSHREQIGTELAVAGVLYESPAVVLCHDMAPDPLFVFANLAAQRLWERSWDDFIGWPSRLTAPPEERAARSQALAHHEVVRGYAGIRVSRTGRRFRISDATVWPVADDEGTLIGQAATFAHWEFLEEESGR